MRPNTPLDQCDVHDKEKLAVFRFFRNQWIEMINGKDEHAIHTQLTQLLSADLEFRTINFARKLSQDAGIKQNGFVHLFVDRGFVAHQSLAIRRITEEYDGQKRKAVYSLWRLISEIEDLITREFFVCVDGALFEPKWGEWDSHSRHDAFDELSRVHAGNRSRSDLIHPEVFRELRWRFESSKSFRNYANKLLAHAADPVTRSGEEAFRLTELDHAYADLIWVANRLSVKILFDSSHAFLPTYTFDGLAHLDNPVCPPEKMKDLRDFWTTRYRELEQLERKTNNWDGE